MADDAVPLLRLTVALLHARHKLLLLNGCIVSDSPKVEALLPADVRGLFWRVEAGEALEAADEALAALAGYSSTWSRPEPSRQPHSSMPRLRLVADNDA